MSKYDSDFILDNAKLLIKKSREYDDDPQSQMMALKAAADQIERETVAEIQVQALFNALKGSQ